MVMSDKAECRMAEGGIIWTLLLPDLGFLLDLNVDPKRFIYLRIGGMFVILEFLFIFKILQPKLKSFTSRQRKAPDSKTCLA